MISLSTIQKSYDNRVDLRLDGGATVRNAMVASNIPSLLLESGRRAVVLTQPVPIVIAVIAEEHIGDKVSISFERTGSLKIDGVLDMMLPGVIKCAASGFKSGTGFWLEYNAGVSRLFIGSDTGQYLAWNGTVLELTGGLLVNGKVPWATAYGPVTESQNLVLNPDFGIYHSGFGIAEDWVLSGQAVLIGGA